MTDGFTTALVGLIAALLGGFIQSFASRNLEKFRFDQNSKWDLYSAYFVTLGKLSFTVSSSEAHASALAEMAHIRARIAIYGSSEVVRAVGKVFEHPTLGTAEAQAAMAIALDAMRNDVGRAKGPISSSELTQIMFGSARVESRTGKESN
jgi:hypothetical protein